VQILFVMEREHWVATHYRRGEVTRTATTHKFTPSLQEQLVCIYEAAVKNGGLFCTSSAAGRRHRLWPLQYCMLVLVTALRWCSTKEWWGATSFTALKVRN